MLPRPDSQSFTKFALSAGVFLVVAAFVLPGLILRDTDVLRISQRELAGVPPVARQELERRQEIARDAGHAAPFLFGLLLLGGVALIGFGVPRLKRQEEKDEERSSMEMDKLRGELEPQSSYERDEQHRAETVEELEGDAAAAVEELAANTSAEMAKQEEVFRSYLNRSLREGTELRARVESQVLARIAEIAPPTYELESQVKIPGASYLRLDGLLIAGVDQLPDILVEIKLIRTNLGANAGKRIAEMTTHLSRYRAHFDRPSLGWVILVAGEPPERQERERIESLALRYGKEKDLVVSVVGADRVSDLSWPPGL